MTGSFLSVFTFVKGRQHSEDKCDQKNQRESQRSKLLSRIFFFLIVAIEQGLLYGGIVYACTSKYKKIDFEWTLFIIVMSAVLVSGISLEIIVHMFFNPVAEERDYFKERKYTFLGIIGLSLLGALLGSIGFYANWLLWTVVPIFCVLAVILAILKCNVKEDKKVCNYYQI